jgi:hypothetical protein
VCGGEASPLVEIKDQLPIGEGKKGCGRSTVGLVSPWAIGEKTMVGAAFDTVSPWFVGEGERGDGKSTD